MRKTMEWTGRKRGYQENFSLLHPRIHNMADRAKKARKIRQLLAESNTAARFEPAVCLDIGCSSGLITSQLASLCDQMIGMDYDNIALHLAPPFVRERVSLLRGDAMSMPFPDQSIDLVLCAQVYEHVPDDVRLFEEIYRVLRPGGVVFFSGPNWLFPIEPHYYLPFLHWLPERWADRYLRLTGKGDRYYERSRHLWGLRKLLRQFAIEDVTLNALKQVDAPWLSPIVTAIPAWLWRFLLPLLPNFNWILYKPMA